MSYSATSFFKNSAIHWERSRIKDIPKSTRGIYVLFRQSGAHMNVVYIGVSGGVVKTGIQGRLNKHAKQKDFTHFSVFEVWDNISELQINEMEGLFLQIYAKDEHANVLNIQKSYAPLTSTHREKTVEWLTTTRAGGS